MVVSCVLRVEGRGLTAAALVGVVGHVVCFEDEAALWRSLLDIKGLGCDD